MLFTSIKVDQLAREKYVNLTTSLHSASFISWQHCTACIRPLLTASPPTVKQSIDISCLVGSQQHTCSSGRWDRQMVQTDGRPTLAQTLLCILWRHCQWIKVMVIMLGSDSSIHHIVHMLHVCLCRRDWYAWTETWSAVSSWRVECCWRQVWLACVSYGFFLAFCCSGLAVSSLTLYPGEPTKAGDSGNSTDSTLHQILTLACDFSQTLVSG